MKDREQQINELPDELIAEAKDELKSLESFIALPTNAAEDEAIFTLALEMQEERRLQAAMRATDHLASFSEQAEEHVPVPELEEAERLKRARRVA